MQIHQKGRWKPASEAYQDFAEAHPEFGIKGNGNSWIHFQRTHAPALIEAGVIRRAAFRKRMIADTERFEEATFDLLTTGCVFGKRAPAAGSLPADSLSSGIVGMKQ